MIYTGIGSRQTPLWCIKYFEKIGKLFGIKGWVLRSGGAIGADAAFERGCNKVNGLKEIFVPEFNPRIPHGIIPNKTKQLYKIANEAFEPRIGRELNTCKKYTQNLMMRNVCQILGLDLNNPSNFVICWTEGGTGKGGTGQAIETAKNYNVPIFDCGKYDKINIIQETKEFLKSIL